MNMQRKKITAAVALAVASFHAAGALAEQESNSGEEQIQEIIVSAPFQQPEPDTALPVGVLSGAELREKISNSLGETLKNEIGLANASFGTGVGLPVIRGQSGNRVQVLQNSVGTIDVSKMSPDHANPLEPGLAERIEVIRGPATLLYGSGAVGGAVNIIYDRIPETLPEDTGFAIQQSHDTGSSENKTLLQIDGAAGNVAFHLHGFTRSNDNIEINGYAIDEHALEQLEELMHGHHEDEHHDEDVHAEEVENTYGFIGNSNAESDGGNFGFSFIGDDGFIGFSISEFNSDFGLPLGAHTHAHHEEEHEEHEEHEHEDEHGHDDHAAEVEFVRLAVNQTRYDVKGELQLSGNWVQNIRFAVGFSDYAHDEVEFFADGDSHVGTRYQHEGTEARITMTHVPLGNWTGVWGVHLLDTVFSATGEEAFIPESDLNSIGLFGVERYDSEAWTAELGIRFEDNGVDPNGRCRYSGNSVSLSGSVLYDLGSDANLLLGASRSQRAPAVEELFSNIATDTCARHADNEHLFLHVANNLLEIGNPQLSDETSNNIEFGYRKHRGSVTGELSVYYNQIDDFIYLGLTGEEFEEQQIAAYQARDARFSGIEGEVSFSLIEAANASLALGLYGDLVNADFDSGGNVPRIPAARIGADLHYFGSNWSVRLDASRVQEQGDVAEFELPTGAYTLLSLYANYRWSLAQDRGFEVFLRGSNLLDEEIRNHVSFLKNYAPEPGRSLMMGVRFEY